MSAIVNFSALINSKSLIPYLANNLFRRLPSVTTNCPLKTTKTTLPNKLIVQLCLLKELRTHFLGIISQVDGYVQNVTFFQNFLISWYHLSS